MLHKRTFAPFTILLFAIASPASPQIADSSGSLLADSRLGFSVGTLMPQRGLSQTLTANQKVEVQFGDVRVVGANFELPVGFPRLGLRASVDYGADQKIFGEGGPCLFDGSCTGQSRTGDLWLAHLDAIYRLGGSHFVQPHILIGVGTQHFTGDRLLCMPGQSSAAYCQAVSSYARPDWRASGRVGAGVELRLGHLAIVSEFGSQFSRITPGQSAQDTPANLDTLLQYDLYWTAGLRLIGR